MSAIDSGRIVKTYPHAVKQYLPDYMGLIFEKMCQDYLLYYSDNLPIELSEIGQWWGTDPKKKKQIQIDIVGTPVEGRTISSVHVSTEMKKLVWMNSI